MLDRRSILLFSCCRRGDVKIDELSVVRKDPCYLNGSMQMAGQGVALAMYRLRSIDGFM